eukprot:4204415-Pyramimonas_sp.AAC.1
MRDSSADGWSADNPPSSGRVETFSKCGKCCLQLQPYERGGLRQVSCGGIVICKHAAAASPPDHTLINRLYNERLQYKRWCTAAVHTPGGGGHRTPGNGTISGAPSAR